ncbi:MAG: hypothetical protein JO129_01860 [Candidatus Dependentiae bacterium]|nr:hypothetical protein [Candidatus Dependentiae bacterium]
MRKTNKLYLSLGMLLSIGSIVYPQELYIESRQALEVITTQQAHIENMQSIDDVEQIEQEINHELLDLFSKFFNEKDATPFSKIITRLIAILKVKRNTLHGLQQIKCDNIINELEKNKAKSQIAIWIPIFLAPDLHDLMTEQARSYINGIPPMTMMRTLMIKLKNNNLQ